MHAFVQSKIAPSDTTMAEPDSEKADSDTSVSLEKLFGESEKSKTVADTSGSAESDIFEAELFFLHPNTQQTILVPLNKQEKFKRLLALDEIQKIIQEEAGDAEFLWGAKEEYKDQFYEVYLVNKRAELTGETITEADPHSGSQMDPNSIGKFEVSFTLNDDGARIFSRVPILKNVLRLCLITRFTLHPRSR
jgi:preprotein translocase subunit SecD